MERVDAPRTRLMGLRAIMDGRGAGAAILTRAENVAFLSGEGRGALIVTASACVRVAVPDLPGRLARLTGEGRRIGFDADEPPEGVAEAISLAADMDRLRAAAS
ncbi:hypothetical protein KTN05_05465 [Paracoccus sp. Z118]|uniref:hypothetical protein n=1 Tax=Paracoccus sp. Z118 TaxID=2851017 RepID=UPI001C2C0ACB|nr:hypothetical protein [Paracoccus sp. Z118]MBV0891299.1 hypothetical protein [Paracoccus sp. Z118]